MIHRGTGITVAGQAFVDLAPGCADVVECYIHGPTGINYLLQRVVLPVSYNTAVVSIPTMYMMDGPRMHLWPTPDKAYALHMSWNPNTIWPVGWYAGYEAALKAAVRARDLATTGIFA